MESILISSLFLHERIKGIENKVIFSKAPKDTSPELSTVTKYLKGKSKHQINAALGEIQLATNYPYPKWYSFFKKVSFKSAPTDLQKKGSLKLACPFADLTIQALRSFLNDSAQILTEQAIEMLHKQITDIVAGIHEQAVKTDVNFLSFKNQIEKDIASEQWSQELDEEKIYGFYQNYPALCRRSSETCLYIITTLTEAIQRLESDSKKLIKKGLLKGYPEQIEKVMIGLSDFHDNRSGVIKFTTTKGDTVVYKPKDLSTDQIYSDFLDQCFKHQFTKFRHEPIPVVSGTNYGWAKFVKESFLFRDNFWSRYGEIAALHLLLGSSDLMFENVLATDHGVQVIDTELILNNYFGNEKVKNHDIPELRFLSDGLLPYWSIGHKDIRDTSTFRKVVRQYINDKGINLTQVDEQITEPLIEGFQGVINRVVENKNTFLSILSAYFKDIKHRYLLRDTSFYAKVIQLLNQGRYAKDGLTSSLTLMKVFDNVNSGNGLIFDYYYQEIVPLLKNQVPKFSTKADSTNLYQKDNIVFENFFPLNSFTNLLKHFENVTTNINQINEELRTCLQSNIPLLFKESSREEKLLAFIHQVFDLIYRGINEDLNDQTLSLKIRDAYSGNLGKALFMGAYGKVTKRKGVNQIIEAYINDYLDVFEKINEEELYKDIYNLGLDFYTISYLYNSGNIKLDPKKISRLLIKTSQSAEKFTCSDLIAGLAGWIIGLSSWHTLFPSEELSESIEKCATHLEKLSVEGPEASIIWPDSEGNIFTGISHGNAGKALALFEAYKITNREAFSSAAKKALRFEEFMKGDLNWYWNFKTGERANKNAFSWCYGGPGIAFSRIALNKSNISSTESEVYHAIKSLKNNQGFLPKVDGLCCGKAGIAELLNTAGMEYENKEWLEESLSIMVSIIEDKSYHQDSRLWKTPLGFFQGLSGLGFEAARLLQPEKVPCYLKMNLENSN